MTEILAQGPGRGGSMHIVQLGLLLSTSKSLQDHRPIKLPKHKVRECAQMSPGLPHKARD